MSQIKFSLSGVLFLAIVLTAGCARDAGTMDEITDAGGSGASGEETETGASSGAGDASSVNSSNLDESEQTMDPLDIRVIYFDFDEAIVNDESREIIRAHADLLATYPDTSIEISGHADERGTREYNLALGEQRGQSVSSYFQEFGIRAERINVVSYGEELPAAAGFDEAAWTLNRRAEFDYVLP